MDQINDTGMRFAWPKEFIDLDIRKGPRMRWQSYQISQDFFWHRHSNTLPTATIERKTLLDLGCYLGATGHWALSHGCSHYTGVELIPVYLSQAKELLSRYHSTDRFSLLCHEIGDFLERCQTRYDVVVAWGVLNSFSDPVPVIKHLCRIGDRVLIDCPIPRSIKDLNDVGDQRAIIELNPMSSQMQITDSDPVTFQGSRVSLSAIEMIGSQCGFRADRGPYQTLVQALPDVYGLGTDHGRAMCVLVRDDSMIPPMTYQDIYV